MRPSAEVMLAELETLWQACCYSLVMDTDADSATDPVAPSFLSPSLLSSVSQLLTPASRQYSESAPLPPMDDKSLLMNPSNPRNKVAIRAISNKMVTDPQEDFRRLHEAGGAWVVVSCGYPHIIFHSTPNW